MKARIYHNPCCSKSRATMAFLRERDIELDIVEYLATPPKAAALEKLIAKLGVPARTLVRTGETAFKETRLDLDDATDREILELIEREPSILQRPIVEVDDGARIGRPPEVVLELFE